MKRTNVFQTPAQIEWQQFQDRQRFIGAMDRERAIRNRERDFARATGWQYEPYWETADIEELAKAQREYDSQYR